ncbi:hypothetical protein [Salipaludibacillus daqingensis]|uniref:hypothetical protein n=1 Tax=Salipaludibacillus daqingensis TaxID=3041001 RepID=UPI003CC8A8E0
MYSSLFKFRPHIRCSNCGTNHRIVSTLKGILLIILIPMISMNVLLRYYPTFIVFTVTILIFLLMSFVLPFNMTLIRVIEYVKFNSR